MVIKVNVYVKKVDILWLFDDLLNHFAAAQLPAIQVVISEHPLSDADCWVAIRTHEAVDAPDYKRTVACIHDLYQHDGIYQPKGRRRVVNEVGGLVFCHLQQRKILQHNNISLSQKKILERPIGPLKQFKPGKPPGEKFTIGWVGRNFSKKRLEWFIEAMLQLPINPKAFRVILVGSGLEDMMQQLKREGIECHYYPKEHNSIEQYPDLYRQMHCLVITSSIEAGPLTLFEALACGIAVVSTPVGWAPELAAKAPEHVLLADSVAAISQQIYSLWSRKKTLFEQRHKRAALVNGWSMEGWVKEVLELAVSLGESPTRSNKCAKSIGDL
jgi:glycosyltransferase involved in cell wall biosynthesis